VFPVKKTEKKKKNEKKEYKGLKVTAAVDTCEYKLEPNRQKRTKFRSLSLFHLFFFFLLGMAARQAGGGTLYFFVNLNAFPGVKGSILRTQGRHF